jgi:hypothetical protein
MGTGDDYQMEEFEGCYFYFWSFSHNN